ncbi:MAG TPA: ATP-binding protein, partial [Coriobacteriia bacterium]|nr:ATP-binding protein [Coriobacteriia bacterium]
MSRTYPAVADSVHIARHALCAFAADCGAHPQQVEAVRLASSEALTNAVIHAYRDEPGQIQVSASELARRTAST